MQTLEETTVPAAPATAEEFARLTDGLQMRVLTEVLGVTRQMVFLYRRHGAPPERVQAIRDYLARRGAEAAGSGAAAQ